MSSGGLSSFDPVAALLGDLDTLTSLAAAAGRGPGEGLVPGETRPAAILLADIVGFSPLAQVLGPEALSALTDRVFRIFELTVESHGGYCDKLIGDAGLYVFPGHLHYSPPCQAALRAALGLQQRVGQMNESLGDTGVQLSIRCGVSFGEVTRQRIGGDSQQVTVLGSAVNLAQRLESNAAPGTVCTVAEVLDETGDMFASESRGTVELKGLGARELFTVTAERERPVHLRGRGQISPLVGRGEVLDEAAGVVREWLKAKGQRPKAKVESRVSENRTDVAARPGELGSPQRQTGRSEAESGTTNRLLILRGPTAVGKSRLAWELTRKLADELPLSIATAHCTPHGGLLTFAAELCKVAGLTAENIAARWAELCADPESEYAQHLPLLAYVLGSSSVDTAAIRQGDSAAFGAACKAALSACLELTARSGLLPVLVVEDIQWLGELEDVLAHLLHEVQLPQPLIVIATARVSVEAELLQRLGAEQHVIDIAGLTLQQGRELLEALLPGAQLPDILEAELHEKSLGLPYYYEEAARLLLRQGVVVPAAEGYEFSGPLAELPIPDDLRTLILGRLDTLPPQLRELAQHASVLGRSFELELLLKLEAQIGGLSSDEVHAALLALHDERILHADLGGATDADVETPRYFFLHLLTREAAYASLLSVNRRRLHGAAGDITALAHLPGTAAEWDLLPLLYDHYVAAQRWPDACRVACDTLMLRARSHRLDLCDEWRSKAEECLGLAANDVALEAHYKWALGVIALIGRDSNQARTLLESALLGARASANRKLEVLVTLDLAQVLSDLRDYALAGGLLLEMRDLAEASDFNIRERLLDLLGAIYRKQGRIKESLEVMEEAVTALRDSTNFNQLAKSLVRLANGYIDFNDIEKALATLDEAQDVVLKQSNHTLEVMLISNRGMCYGLLGDSERAIRTLEEGLERSRAIGWKEGEAHNCTNLGHMLAEQGLLVLAESHLTKAVSLFRELNNLSAVGTTLGTLAEMQVDQERLGEAETNLKEAESYFQITHGEFQRGIIQCIWAKYYLAAEQPTEAVIAISRAKALSRHTTAGSQSSLNLKIAEVEQLTTPSVR